MNTPNTIQVLAPFVGSGLIMSFKEEHVGGINMMLTVSDFPFLSKNKTKPICYGWEYLTQEITVAGYNNGNSFVPADVIYNKSKGAVSIVYGEFYLRLPHESKVAAEIDELPYWVVKLLIQWHFPIGLTDYIEVTKENNPY